MNSFSCFFRKHWIAFSLALVVGALYVAPHVLFIVSLGDEYRGIPLMMTQNEDYYYTRIREVIDGHFSTGSLYFREYKDEPSLTPPTVEFLYALPTLLFDISPVTTVIASRFFLPAVLFLLVYVLLLRLTERSTPVLPPESCGDTRLTTGHTKEAGAERLFSASQKLNAVAGALFVTLGYELVDYRSMWRFLTGETDLAGSFLVWSRVPHPVVGAILLFSFLLMLWSVLEHSRHRKAVIIGGGAFMALMFASYFFSWGLAFSAWGALLLVYLLKRDYAVVKDLSLMMGVGVFFAIPYWLSAFQASRSPWYTESLLRGGLFYTHYPLLNKLMLAVSILYIVVAVLIPVFKKMARSYGVVSALIETIREWVTWQWFTLAVIAGSLGVYTQQVVTGRTIWPYHFAQYTIALAIVISTALWFVLARPRARYLWGWSIAAVIVLSLSYGIAVQATVYRTSYASAAATQRTAALFEFLTAQKEECVVLYNKLHASVSPQRRNWNLIVTMLTPCDIYAESGYSFLVPYERVLHSYLVLLRLSGVSADEIEAHIAEKPSEIQGFLFSNWAGMFRVRDFPDFDDPVLDERIRTLPQIYREFLQKDFREELHRYRLDYILSMDPLDSAVLAELPGTELIRQEADLYLYQFR